MDMAQITGLIESQGRAFEAFKQENDARVKALASGKADVLTEEKVDRISAEVREFQAAIDELNTKLAAAKLGGGVVGRSPDPDYSKAYAAYVRKGDIHAALDKGTASEGGYTTPTEWDRTVTDRLVLVSPMRQIATVQQIGVGAFSKLFNARGMGSGWVGETASRPETTAPTFGTLTYSIGEIYANPSATQQILDDSLIDIEQFISDNIATEFAYQEGVAFVSGNGTNKPNGFLTYATGAANAATHPWGAIAVTTAASATTYTSNELLTLVYALPSDYTANARWVMNRSTMAIAMKLQDSTGQYLWQPSIQAGQPALLMGFPVTEMAAMPNVATTAIPVAFGDFRRGYLIIDRIGIRVLRDPYSNKPYVMFYTTKRVGGGLLNPDVIKVLKMA